VVGGAAPTGPGDENLQQPELDEPLANPRRKKEGRRSLSFTGSDEDAAAAKNRGGGNGEWGCSSACGGIAGAKRGAGARARA
jgi:hypothetical protein